MGWGGGGRSIAHIEQHAEHAQPAPSASEPARAAASGRTDQVEQSHVRVAARVAQLADVPRGGAAVDRRVERVLDAEARGVGRVQEARLVLPLLRARVRVRVRVRVRARVRVRVRVRVRARCDGGRLEEFLDTLELE